MMEFQRQHVIASVTKTLTVIRQNIVSLIVLFVVGSGSETFSLAWIAYIGIPFLFIAGVASWYRFLYRISDEELHIKSGILVRKNMVLKKDRIQVIDISSGVLLRLFGLVRVDVQTAGSSSREARIDAVTLQRAKEIYRLLRENGENADSEQEQPATDKLRQTIKLPVKNLFIAATTSGRFGIILSVIATVYSQIQPVLEDTRIFEIVADLIPAEAGLVLFFYILVLFFLIAWFLSFMSTVLTYGNFQLELRDDEVVISRGIFEQKRITVPFHRIQAVHVKEGLLRQPLGYASVHIESAGYGDQAGSGTFVLYPLLPRKKVAQFLERVLPGYHISLDGIKPPARALRRYIFRSAIVITAVVAALYFLLDLPVWIWLFALLSIGWGWLRYRDACLSWNDEFVLVSSRFLSKQTAFIKRNRLQSVQLSASPIQRWRKLSTPVFHVASGDAGQQFQVTDIDAPVAEMLYTELEKSTIEPFLPMDAGHQPMSRIPAWSPAPQAASEMP
ncbi:MAG: PH domain-containing protein [Balneolaceae bacterium]